jgi:deoxyinosine 3'endonuclease (endonuclease V)
MAFSIVVALAVGVTSVSLTCKFLDSFNSSWISFRTSNEGRIFLLWDGHGIAHPRRCGLASHLGVLLNIPSVGVAEELVYGTCNVDALNKERGSHIPVLDPTTAPRPALQYARAVMSVLSMSA